MVIPSLLLILLSLLLLVRTYAFYSPNNRVQQLAFHRNGNKISPSSVALFKSPSLQSLDLFEQKLLDILGDGKISLSKEEEFELDDALSNLLSLENDVKTSQNQESVIGEWELLYTTKSKFDITNPLGKRQDGSAPGLEQVFPILFGKSSDDASSSSSSPIQRIVTEIESVRIYQNIEFQETKSRGRVDQLVKNNNGDVLLRLSAAATFDTILANRINFEFDLAYFNVLGVRVPYPVPFRLLGDEARGYLDTRLVTNKLRISTGNKGTTFILRRKT